MTLKNYLKQLNPNTLISLYVPDRDAYEGKLFKGFYRPDSLDLKFIGDMNIISAQENNRRGGIDIVLGDRNE